MEISEKKTVRWYNRKTKTFIYGIDVKIKNKWRHFTDIDKPLFYSKRKDALQKLKDIIVH